MWRIWAAMVGLERESERERGGREGERELAAATRETESRGQMGGCERAREIRLGLDWTIDIYSDQTAKRTQPADQLLLLPPHHRLRAVLPLASAPHPLRAYPLLPFASAPSAPRLCSPSLPPESPARRRSTARLAPRLSLAVRPPTTFCVRWIGELEDQEPRSLRAATTLAPSPPSLSSHSHAPHPRRPPPTRASLPPLLSSRKRLENSMNAHSSE